MRFAFASPLPSGSTSSRSWSARCCRGPGSTAVGDPLRWAGEVAGQGRLNATFAESRGVFAFSLATFAYHLDRPGQQFDRKFHIDVVGECCILTREHTIDVLIPAGA